MKSVYNRAMKDKTLAASILIPLIEFEFSFAAEESPVLIQSKINKRQLDKVFEICKSHNWTTKIMSKGQNIGFKLHRNALREICSIAGEFADPVKNEWAKLLIEREGMKGGYMGNKISTEEKILSLMKKSERWWSIGELCLALRLMPSTIRETLREMESTGKAKRRKESKRVLWNHGNPSLDT
ncbi:MAG: hypothetical protein HYT72_01100 [Candidatus Aenigmarchaeota archaeon]|nr:hypothetical protein [Candidatus Aenigmarchaeota archaeon]